MVFFYQIVNGLVFYMMPPEVIFDVDMCTMGSSASAPRCQGGRFHQVTPATVGGIDEHRRASEAGHELNELFQGDQASPTWDLFPLHLPSPHA